MDCVKSESSGGFSKGQRVRCINVGGYRDMREGGVYTVLGTDGDSSRDGVLVYLEGLNGGRFGFRFEPVAEPRRASRFRVGDRVWLLDDNSPLSKGNVYPVTGIKGLYGSDGRPLVGVRGRNFSGVLCDDMGCFDHSLELVERTKFEPGDRVRVLRRGEFGVAECAVGKQADVVEVGVDNDGPWVDINVPGSELMDGAGSLRQVAQPSDLWPLEHEQPLTARYEAPTPTYSVEAELSKARQVIETLEQEVEVLRGRDLERASLLREVGAVCQSRDAEKQRGDGLARHVRRLEQERDEAVARLRALHDADVRLDRERNAMEEFLDRLDGADIPF